MASEKVNTDEKKKKADLAKFVALASRVQDLDGLREAYKMADGILETYSRPVFYIVLEFGSKGRYGNLLWWYQTKGTLEAEDWLVDNLCDDGYSYGTTTEHSLAALIKQCQIKHVPEGELVISAVQTLTTSKRKLELIGRWLWTEQIDAKNYGGSRYSASEPHCALDTSHADHEKLYARWEDWARGGDDDDDDDDALDTA